MSKVKKFCKEDQKDKQHKSFNSGKVPIIDKSKIEHESSKFKKQLPKSDKAMIDNILNFDKSRNNQDLSIDRESIATRLSRGIMNVISTHIREHISNMIKEKNIEMNKNANQNYVMSMALNK